MSLNTNNHRFPKLSILFLSFVLLFGYAFAVHDAIITIDPAIANCSELGNTFNVNVKNDDESDHNIFEVRIYKAVAGLSDFSCGPAPSGWTLFDFTGDFGYCEYKTHQSSSNQNTIAPGESVDFSFDAVMSSDACASSFLISTLDNAQPIGEHEFNSPQVFIDCRAPEVTKMVGDPKIVLDACEEQDYNGLGNQACNYYGTQNTEFAFWGDESTEINECNLGFEGEQYDVDDGYCQFRYSVNGGEPSEWEPFYGDPYSLHFEEWQFEEDSNHFVEIECVDIAGNVTTVTEIDYIETVPPDTNKMFIGPVKIAENGAEWIDSVTLVELTAEDPEPHPSGVDKIWYKNVVFQNPDKWNKCYNPQEYCEAQFPSPYETQEYPGCIDDQQDYCDENWEEDEYDSWEECVEERVYNVCGVSEQWNLYRGEPIEKDQESCHLLQFFSVDNLGNEEGMNVNCFFVDKTPPYLEKRVGQPSGDDYDYNAFPDTNGLFHWVTPQTDITFYCADQEPHPAEGEELLLKVSYDLADDGYLTEEYCAKYGGTMEDGWCVIPIGEFEENVFVFNFNEEEDSMHDLEYFCRDAVGKRTETELQNYKVDSTPPSIEKEMFGSWLGDCPPQDEDDECFVADNGTSGVSINVSDGGEICHVDDVWCNYEVWWETDEETCDEEGGEDYDDGWCLIDGGEFSSDANVVFREDSTHELRVYCEDGLGNSVEDTETFLVDSTPPETTKMYSDPFFSCTDWCEYEYPDNEEGQALCVRQVCGGYDGHSEEAYPHWITSDTNVSLWAEDEKVGVDKIFWRNQVIGDEEGFDACNEVELCNPEFYYQFIDPQAPFNDVNGEHVTFQKEGESCHVIEYYSVDKLGNTEELNWQCVFVDNTPPEGLKRIGEPHVIKFDGEICEENGEDGGGGGGVGGDYNVGDEVDTITFPEGGSTGVGVAFDGEFLYYTYISSKNLYKIRPDGSGHAVIPTSGVTQTGLGALSYDADRGKLWAGTYGCDGSGGGPVYLIDPVTGDATYMFSVSSAYITYCLDDGIAYDATDDSIWYSDDVSEPMVHMDTNGDFLGTVDVCAIDSRLCHQSGIAIGGDNFYLGTNGSEVTLRVDRDTLTLLDEFVNTGFRIEDMECDPDTFSPTEVMWIRDAYAGQARAYAIEPQTCGLGGQPPEPKCDGEREDWVTTKTPFLLDCEDQEPHPVDHETVNWRFSFHDGNSWSYSDWYGAFGPVEVSFEEESLHDLEFYCEDALGNTGETDVEYFFVEDTPPVIEKTVVGPQIGDCPPQEEGDRCIIDGVTEIHVDAFDPEPHPVNEVLCDWSYYVADDDGAQGGEQGVTPPFVINFPEESEHHLTITCYDALGNTSVDEEVFFVDKTPPITEKRFGEDPYFSCYDWCYALDGQEWESCLEQYCALDEGEHWVPQWGTSDLNVFLSAFDPEPHPSDVNMTFYRITQVDDNFCDVGVEEEYNEVYCDDAEGSGEWQKYTGEPFNVDEESCHLIEYYSVDNVNKVEDAKRECIYIDNTGPDPIKTVGEPGETWDGADAVYYDIDELCWNGQEDQIECWKVTLLTPITMACDDPEPHPVDHSSMFFMVDFDG
ncbi:MAG TPA: hypothetical protein HA237_06100, partial [Candidatus Diapherotrites archaeon]|nr:hypothetical protein [Candidatus Diapherotrites archaeon]